MINMREAYHIVKRDSFPRWLEEVYVKRKRRREKEKKKICDKEGESLKGRFPVEFVSAGRSDVVVAAPRGLKCGLYIDGTCQCILLGKSIKRAILLYGMCDEKHVGIWRMVGGLKVTRFHGDGYSPFAVLSFL
jgi:hypothetical protein